MELPKKHPHCHSLQSDLKTYDPNAQYFFIKPDSLLVFRYADHESDGVLFVLLVLMEIGPLIIRCFSI